MKTSEFKRFKQYIETMETKEEQIYIASCGFFWIDLTEKQVNKIAKILRNKDYCKSTFENGTEIIHFENYELAITDEYNIIID